MASNELSYKVGIVIVLFFFSSEKFKLVSELLNISLKQTGCTKNILGTLQQIHVKRFFILRKKLHFICKFTSSLGSKRIIKRVT